MVEPLYIFAFGTLLSHIVFLAVAGVFLTRKRLEFSEKSWNRLHDTATEYGPELAFIASLGASIGSLLLSNFAGLEPCLLCWYQRIFMFPLPIILGTGILLENKDSADYAIPLALIGLAVAVYHYTIQMINLDALGCAGLAVECSEAYAVHFGYVTIP